MKDKTCLITGGNSGIGKEAAVALAAMGANVVIVARNRTKGEAAVEEIKQRGGSGSVDLRVADLSSQKAIHALADDIESTLPRLDVLLNNAGLTMGERVLTVDGLETTFAVNHLGYFLLTDRLLGKLRESAPSRIVNVASDAHRRGHVDFDNLQGEKGYSGWGAYCQSKLANVLYTYELSRRIAGSGVTANCLHPGVVATNFASDGPFLIRTVFRLASVFLTTPKKGAETSVYLASSPAVEGVTGKYFSNSRETRSNAESYDESVARRLWEVSEKLTSSAR